MVTCLAMVVSDHINEKVLRLLKEVLYLAGRKEWRRLQMERELPYSLFVTIQMQRSPKRAIKPANKKLIPIYTAM